MSRTHAKPPKPMQRPLDASRAAVQRHPAAALGAGKAPGQALSPERVLALQAVGGNRAIVGVVQRGAATSKSTVGRVAAVAATQNYGVGTLGYLIHQSVKPFASILGDVAAGQIGQHYRDRADALAQPLTKAGIIRFAITETLWWNQQPGIPGFVGSLMSKRMRAHILLSNARRLNLLAPERGSPGDSERA